MLEIRDRQNGYEVFVDGKYVGRTFSTSHQLLLPIFLFLDSEVDEPIEAGWGW